jgi:O-acetyl-ADP-ribose deacetylase (regulator of RNase III)/uncharacterized protein YwgA
MEYLKGNLLDANTQALVNTVNTVGVMGKGIALQFKEAFPSNFRQYAEACKKKTLQVGQLLVVKEQTLQGEKIIINFPTKTEWYHKSKYEYIEEGLKALVTVIETHPIESIAIPPLGCGNGGLKWDSVKLLLEKYLAPLKQVQIQIFEPHEAIKQLLKQQETRVEAKLTPARAILLYAMFYYETLGENVSLFVANKLVYFLQRLGEPSLNKLKFERSHYGPYSHQVVHLLHHVNGKYLKGLEQMSVKAFEPLEMQYDKLKEVSDFVKQELKSEQRIILVNLIKLIDGFQSALSLEVLATVDFILKDKPNISHQELVSIIHSWSERKQKLFRENYIRIAYDHLETYKKKGGFFAV